MFRCTFLKSFTALVGGFDVPVISQAKLISAAPKVLQHFPLAGFQYHHGEILWAQLAVGQPLHLMREVDNRYDNRAVRVEWQGQQAGLYSPPGQFRRFAIA